MLACMQADVRACGAGRISIVPGVLNIPDTRHNDLGKTKTVFCTNSI